MGQGWILAGHSSLGSFAFCPVRLAVGLDGSLPLHRQNPEGKTSFSGVLRAHVPAFLVLSLLAGTLLVEQ